MASAGDGDVYTGRLNVETRASRPGPARAEAAMIGGMGSLHATRMTTRIAEARDVSGVAALICLAYRVEAFFVEGDRTNADDVRARMARGHFLLLEDSNGALAGCVYVEIRGERGYFGMLSIYPGPASARASAHSSWPRPRRTAAPQVARRWKSTS